MGCCVSTEENRATQEKQSSLSENHHHHHHSHHHSQCVSKSPPRPEEETVKEVLSETPKPKPKPKQPNSILSPQKNANVANPKAEVLETEEVKFHFEVKEKQKEEIPIKGNHILDPGFGPNPDEVSVSVSECSVSETISTSTLREDELLDDGEVLGGGVRRVYKPQVQNRNFRNRAVSGPTRSGNPSPARKRNPSPARNGYGGGQRRMDHGMGNNRRSQSPAKRGSNVGRSPSGRRAGPSPGRVRMVESRERREQEEDEVEERERSALERRESGEWNGPSESLENPLVSLECFIFL